MLLGSKNFIAKAMHWRQIQRGNKTLRGFNTNVIMDISPLMIVQNDSKSRSSQNFAAGITLGLRHALPLRPTSSDLPLWWNCQITSPPCKKIVFSKLTWRIGKRGGFFGTFFVHIDQTEGITIGRLIEQGLKQREKWLVPCSDLSLAAWKNFNQGTLADKIKDLEEYTGQKAYIVPSQNGSYLRLRDCLVPTEKEKKEVETREYTYV